MSKKPETDPDDARLMAYFGEEWRIRFEPTGMGSRVQWMIQRRGGIVGDFYWSNVEGGRSGNPKSAKAQAEAALERARDQHRIENQVIRELRGYYNQ